MNEEISICITTYKSGSYLERCVQSCLSQKGDLNVKIYLVSNNLNDFEDLKEKKIIESCTSLHPDLFIHLNSPISGVNFARNLFLDNAKGKYVCFLDGDDYLNDNFLLKLYEEAESENLDIVGCSFSFSLNKFKFKYLLSFKGRIDPLNACIKLLKDFSIKGYVWGKLYKLSFLNENKIRFLNENISTFEDKYFSFISFLYSKKIKILGSSLYNYSVENKNSVTNSDEFKKYLLKDILLVYCNIRKTCLINNSDELNQKLFKTKNFRNYCLNNWILTSYSKYTNTEKRENKTLLYNYIDSICKSDIKSIDLLIDEIKATFK